MNRPVLAHELGREGDQLGDLHEALGHPAHRHPAIDHLEVLAPPHEPAATPTASPCPSGAVYRGCPFASSRHSTKAIRGHLSPKPPVSPSRTALRSRSSIGSIWSASASSSIADSSAK